MPTPALVLLGFMPMQFGINFLLQRSSSNISSNDAKRDWLIAKSRLGQPQANAGGPEILDLPDSARGHTERISTNPRLVDAIQDGDLSGVPWSFKLVEIAPLIAFQFHVETDRAGSFAALSEGAPSIEDLLPIALPDQQESFPIEPSIDGSPAKGQLLLRSQSLNVRPLKAGILNEPEAALGPWDLLKAGVSFGVTLPFVQVVRFENRCYLRNGYHRAYAMAMCGATHIPCLFLEAQQWETLGARGKGGTFERNELRGSNPPTVGHFIRGKAAAVTLRTVRRVIRVSWEEGLEVEEPQLR